jgi:L-histidine N-alpha-methyltransferase
MTHDQLPAEPAAPQAVEPVVRVLLDPTWAATRVLDDVRKGLGSQPRWITPHWLYDDVGSALFDEITRLPEYYPTEREREILRRESDAIAARTGATVLVELGSGTSDKTRTLLDALTATGQLEWFVPVDVSEATLRAAAGDIAAAYPGLQVEAVVADFTAHLDRLPQHGRRLVAFLGGTIGNFDPGDRAAFLAQLARAMSPGDWLLLGTDLVKSADRLVAAYDDPGGVTERFVLNSLHVLDRELDADFDPADFDYVAWWDPREHRMDLRLRVRRSHQVHVRGADLVLDLVEGEEIRVEISTKFRLPAVAAELAAAGFEVDSTFTDAAGDFALTLARRA